MLYKCTDIVFRLICIMGALRALMSACPPTSKQSTKNVFFINRRKKEHLLSTPTQTWKLFSQREKQTTPPPQPPQHENVHPPCSSRQAGSCHIPWGSADSAGRRATRTDCQCPLVCCAACTTAPGTAGPCPWAAGASVPSGTGRLGTQSPQHMVMQVPWNLQRITALTGLTPHTF